MSRYLVYVSATYIGQIEVEAESPADAGNQALELLDPPLTVIDHRDSELAYNESATHRVEKLA